MLIGCQDDEGNSKTVNATLAGSNLLFENTNVTFTILPPKRLRWYYRLVVSSGSKQLSKKRIWKGRSASPTVDNLRFRINHKIIRCNSHRKKNLIYSDGEPLGEPHNITDKSIRGDQASA